MNWLPKKVLEVEVLHLAVTPFGSTPHEEQKLTILTKMELLAEGPRGDCRNGIYRPTTVRDREWAKEGTYALNHRQVSITSTGESVNATMKINEGLPSEGHIDTITADDWMSNMHLQGIPNLSALPGSTICFRSKGGNLRTATLFITEVNSPCHIPYARLKARMGGHLLFSVKDFREATKNLRGVVAIVRVPGWIKVGDTAIVIIPERPVWEE